MYGAQAWRYFKRDRTAFENDVEMYGAQAFVVDPVGVDVFENDVEMYGAQAQELLIDKGSSLRMM